MTTAPENVRLAFARNALAHVKLPWKMALMLSLSILSLVGMGLTGMGANTWRAASVINRLNEPMRDAKALEAGELEED